MYKNQFLVKALSRQVIYKQNREKEVIEQEILLIPELLRATGMSDA